MIDLYLTVLDHKKEDWVNMSEMELLGLCILKLYGFVGSGGAGLAK